MPTLTASFYGSKELSPQELADLFGDDFEDAGGNDDFNLDHGSVSAVKNKMSSSKSRTFFPS